MNLQTSKSVVTALRLARSGRIFSLSHVLEEGMPVNWFHQDFIYSTYRSAPEMLEYFSRSFPNTNRIAFTNLRMEMSDHTGTHIDGLNHAAIGNRFYNGVDTRRVTTTRGTKKLGMETMPPLISRGVLIDMTLNHEYNEREVITLDDCRSVLAQEGLSVKSGDTVLIYTGWERFWKADNQKYLSTMPGIGAEAARWLARARVVAVGSDTQSVEVEPNEDPSEDGVVHQILITENGVHLLENLKLSTLAKAKAYEFLFVCLPLKIRGGTGSPIHPVAVI
ncbi:MAG: cyclase family protein [Nitrososphaerota archaeon]|jgi:kynurenine formamidase|nr:cyclase family protein [Nitrososphaerota archaeon]MDG6943095.1 cyclase family protein [Nitrososphaerota archaeon]